MANVSACAWLIWLKLVCLVVFIHNFTFINHSDVILSSDRCNQIIEADERKNGLWSVVLLQQLGSRSSPWGCV